MEIYFFEICKTSWRNWRYYQEQMLFFLGVVDYVLFEHCCMLLIKTCCVVLCCVDMYVHSWRKNWKAMKTEFSINKFGFPNGISGIPLESLHNLSTHLFLPIPSPSNIMSTWCPFIFTVLHKQNMMSTQTVMIKIMLTCIDATCWCYIAGKDSFGVSTPFQSQYLNEYFICIARDPRLLVVCKWIHVLLVEAERFSRTKEDKNGNRACHQCQRNDIQKRLVQTLSAAWGNRVCALLHMYDSVMTYESNLYFLCLLLVHIP